MTLLLTSLFAASGFLAIAVTGHSLKAGLKMAVPVRQAAMIGEALQIYTIRTRDTRNQFGFAPLMGAEVISFPQPLPQKATPLRVAA